MKSFLVAITLLTGLTLTARAQQEADEKYIVIRGNLQQAESLADTGEPGQALASLLDAQAQLQKFQKVFPDWNPGIVSYRLDDVAKKITALKTRLSAVSIPEPAPAMTNRPGEADVVRLSAQEAALRSQLQSVQAENETLQAKLKEALASQPAAIDASELAKAQEQIRTLMKENDLLKASATLGQNSVLDTNALVGLRRQLVDALDKYSTEHTRAEKLVAENTALQRDLARVGSKDANALDLVRSENDRLKTQLNALQSAASDAAAAKELTSKLKTANAQIASLKTTVTVVTLEKGALENKVKLLAAEVEKLRAQNFEGRLRDLTQQRDELAKQLADASRKNPRKGGDAQLIALNKELDLLRARVSVDEAKAVPYTQDELALFRRAPLEPIRRPISELPSGTVELVASAQRHFANHEFDQAEADYLKILAHDQNNGLVLANLATIELQEDKLDLAEKHITAAVAQSPDDAYNLSTLGFLKFRQEKYDEALDALSRAAKIDPNNPEIQNYLGVTLSHKGLRVQAETALRKAIQLNPAYAPAHNNLAVIYLNQTPPMPQLARWHYQKAVAAGQPRNPDLEKLLGDKGAPVEP